MQEISRLIIEWYRVNKRELPWRQTSDPYHIWLSEVILQQTRVAQGLAYYHRFLEKFPTVHQLAQAPQDEVLEVWQGLGYYSRARNLHAAAKYVAFECKGVFPSNYDSLLKLKGIGKYTAAAIASFAFHEDKAVVDGNVIRVISRLYKIEEDIRLPKVVDEVRFYTEQLLPMGHAYLFNQGIMELGAMVCVPSSPACGKCPVATFCLAFKENLQASIPFKSKAKERRVRFLNYLLIEAEGELLFRKRGSKDIWEGLYEPILLEDSMAYYSPDQFLERAGVANDKVEIVQVHRPTRHILSHQELWVTLCHIRMKNKPLIPDGKWIMSSELGRLPKPVIFSKILDLKHPAQLPLAF